MKIDDQILLNKLAQGLLQIGEGERWFTSFDLKEKRMVLRELNYMIVNASPRSADVNPAIIESGLNLRTRPASC
jgi:hypothetical protein